MVTLFAAYGVIWILIFGYSASITRRQRHLQRQVESLRQLVEDGQV